MSRQNLNIYSSEIELDIDRVAKCHPNEKCHVIIVVFHQIEMENQTEKTQILLDCAGGGVVIPSVQGSMFMFLHIDMYT